MKNIFNTIALAIFLTLGLLTAGTVTVNAQCAQCAATVETNAKTGDKTTNGLNNGILFLLVAPYLAVATVGYIWYKKYRRKNIAIDIPKQKLNLN